MTFSDIFSGNEALVHSNGYYAGSCILLNSGVASHGGGADQGLSKALAMAFVLLVCPGFYAIGLDWYPAWTAINVLHFRRQFQPILNALAIAVNHHFYVSDKIVTRSKSNSEYLGFGNWFRTSRGH